MTYKIKMECIAALLCVSVAMLFSCNPGAGLGENTTALTIADTAHESTADSAETVGSDTREPLYLPDSSGAYTIDAGDLRDIDDFQDILYKIASSGEARETLFTVKITGLSVPVTLEMSSAGGTPLLASISAFGRTITADRQVELYGNCRVGIYEAGGAVVFERLFYDVGDTYVIWDGGADELHPGETESVSLYGEGGALKYRRSANKFNGVKDQVGVLSCAFSRDDFLYEYGGVTLGDGSLTLSDPEKSFTISDIYDLDAEFASNWSGAYATIDALFAANRDSANRIAIKTIYSVDDWPELGLGEEDLRREYISAFISGDTGTLERLSGSTEGLYDGYKTLKLGDYEIQATKDITGKTGETTVILKIDILSSGLDTLSPGRHSFRFCEYPTIFMRDEAGNAGIDTEESQQLAYFFDFTMSYRRESAELYEYIISRLNANGVRVTSLEQITDYASRYLGVNGYIPKNPSAETLEDGSTVYYLPAHGGNHLIFTCVAQSEADGNKLVTVQFYADFGKTITSHLINYTVRCEKGGFAIIGEELLAKSKFEPARYMT